ncbi:L,D-transpeptidase [Chryseobacterium sp.]|uniref:L,D-transpeptidase n=1 Tax=Chryseobacterium sp. TaxID=1871047 RepID=UPI0011CC131A|nr:L,D-transpeptidase [Chryseobacterium sp.]TXF74988.1 L,D-transpeptidase [Chryseobacterium sp.]
MKITTKRILFFLFMGTLSGVLMQCTKEAVKEISPENKVLTKEQNNQKQKAIEDSLKATQIQYTSLIFPKNKKDSLMGEFTKKYSEEEQYIILALNRLDQKNRWRADTLVIPDKFDPTLMLYSPFPRKMEMLDKVNKFVIFSYPIQAYAVYQNGELLKWGPTSMGKKAAQTKRGLMFVNWKKELAISTVDSEWKLPYNVNIHNTLGIGWHQYDLPGFPASHSCLRLLMNDAKWMYNFADTWILNDGGATLKANGTPVIVFGDYKWGGKKPWKMLSDNPAANLITVEDLNEVIKPHLSKILDEQEKREHVIQSSEQASDKNIEAA